MGKFLSKEVTHSIDVSGNHNYVLMLNGVSIDLSSLLHNITHQLVQENQKTVIYTALVSILVTMLLTILSVAIIFSCYMKFYQAHWEMLLEKMMIQIHHIRVIVQRQHLNARS